MATAELEAGRVIAACKAALATGTTYLGQTMDMNGRNRVQALLLLAQCIADQRGGIKTVTIDSEDIRYFGHHFVVKPDPLPEPLTLEQQVYGSYASAAATQPAPGPDEPQ